MPKLPRVTGPEAIRALERKVGWCQESLRNRVFAKNPVSGG